jgi:hypothetical protein
VTFPRTACIETKHIRTKLFTVLIFKDLIRKMENFNTESEKSEPEKLKEIFRCVGCFVAEGFKDDSHVQ